ncbi:hypothetical protein AGMMS49944_07390 [Spirochaetia bacterium]|nr:hypothetical protein AGMMS49944_07390 [Spirochaetia bacterium]
MCTLGSVSGRFLFKNRDMGVDNSFKEDIIRDKRRYAYVGIAGKANEFERGLNSGINEKGVAAAITYVQGGGVSLGDAIRRTIPRGVIVEDIVGNAANLLEAVELAHWHLNRDVHVGGNIVLADETGIVSIEELEKRFAVEWVADKLFFRSNHFLNLNQPIDEGDTLQRLTAIRRAFEGKKAERVDLSHIKKALEYRGDDARIYKKPEDKLESVTVSTVIYDIPARTAHYRYTVDPNTVFQELQP